jgi:hypothetical protein
MPETKAKSTTFPKICLFENLKLNEKYLWKIESLV